MLAGTSVVDKGEIPYRPEALLQRDANREDWTNLDPAAKCYIPGIPRQTYMPAPFQILQTDTEIFIAYEWGSNSRSIFMNRSGTSAPLPSLARHEHTTVVLVSVGSHLCSGCWEGVFHSPHPSHHPLITLLHNRPLMEKGPSNVDCNCFATVTRGLLSAIMIAGSEGVCWIGLVLLEDPSWLGPRFMSTADRGILALPLVIVG